MAKPVQSVLLLASALYLLSLVVIAQGDPQFYVEGEVYCDRCRSLFKNKLSEQIQGAKVRLECRNREEGNLTFSVEGETDKDGKYSLSVDGDHEEDICEIVLLKSPRDDCNEVGQEKYTKEVSRISLTSQSGLADKTRRANPLGYMTKVAVPECFEMYKELGMLPEDVNN